MSPWGHWRSYRRRDLSARRATIADKMLFMVAAMAAETERDLIRECILDGLRAAES